MAQYLISEGKQKTVHWQKRGETCEARGAQRYVITAWLRVLARNLRTESCLLSQKPCEARESAAICTPPANREILLWVLSYKKADYLFINFQTSKVNHCQRFIEILQLF